MLIYVQHRASVACSIYKCWKTPRSSGTEKWKPRPASAKQDQKPGMWITLDRPALHHAARWMRPSSGSRCLWRAQAKTLCSLTHGRCTRFATLAVAAPEAPASQTRPQVPSSLSKVDKGKIMGFGADLAEDHPGFADREYKKRRAAIAQLAFEHEEGEPVPMLEYLPEEQRCWGSVLRELKKLYPTHACHEFLQNLDRYNFTEETVPQLEDISQILRKATGWKIHPVAGLLHPRDFLNGLAFRTFHSTQYMRHHSQPMYTPEPDICHELLGHTVMLANPEYADLVHMIGIASLAADEKQIWHLTKIYWYTVEFGVVREGDEIKAFGAGLLSSYGELQHMRHDNPQLWPFNPFQKQPKMSYKDGYQKGYFVLDSFQKGAEQLHSYCRAITRPELLKRFSLE